MAQNPQDPKDTEKLKKELEDIVKMSSEMEFNFLKTRDASKALIETLTGSSEIVNRIGTFGTQIKNSFIDISQLASRLGTDYIKTEQVQKRIRENAGLQVELQTMQNKFIEEYNKKVAGTFTLNSKGEKVMAKAVSLESARNFILEKAKKNGEASLEDQEKQFLILNQYIDSLKEQEKVLSQIQSKVNDGNTEFTKMAVKGTALKKIFDQLSFIPFLSSFMRFDIIADKFLVSKKEGFRELGKQIKNIVTSPMFLLSIGLIGLVSIMKALVKAAFDFDKQLVQVSNNLGFSRESSIGLLDNFRAISNANAVVVKGLDSAFLSVKNQTAATAELQEVLETNALFTSRMVQSQILLTKQMGLSKEESAGIQKLSILTGKSADDILQNAISQNKTAISYRKIISDISKVNAEISVMYKNNPELIAKAVIEANKLGLSLEDTQKIAKSLLDFETSISGELEAELLTGKRFNFEKARALALDGKSVEAAQELLGQMGGLNELTKLNVIQRERLAASIGLSAEELTKSAREAEILKNLGFENRNALEEQYELMRQRNDQAGISALMEEARKKEGGEILLKDIARANLQQRFEESMERVKQLFTEIAAGPLTKIINGLVKFLSNTTALKAALIGISAVFGAIAAAAITTAIAVTVASGGSNLVAAAAATGGALAAGGLMALMMSGGSEKEALANTPAPGTQVSPATPNRTQNTAQDLSDLQTRVSNLQNNKPMPEPSTKDNVYNTKTPQTPQNNYYYMQNNSEQVEHMYKDVVKTNQIINTKTPEREKMPEVPYTTSTYSPSPTPEDAFRGVVASNTQNPVIQNNVTVEIDGVKVSSTLKKVNRPGVM